MQKTKTVLNMALAISLISIAISVNVSYAQSAPNAFISNVIIFPANTGTAETTQSVSIPKVTTISLMSDISSTTAGTSSSDGIKLLTPPANKRNQSPFFPVTSGMYDIGMTIPTGFTLIDAKCKFQQTNGQWISLGLWNGESIVDDVNLASKKASICTWKLAPAAS